MPHAIVRQIHGRHRERKTTVIVLIFHHDLSFAVFRSILLFSAITPSRRGPIGVVEEAASGPERQSCTLALSCVVAGADVLEEENPGHSINLTLQSVFSQEARM
jgi:hypothetical protein